MQAIGIPTHGPTRISDPAVLGRVIPARESKISYSERANGRRAARRG